MQGEIDFFKSEDMGRQYVVSQATTLAALWSELSYVARQESTKRVVERINLEKTFKHRGHREHRVKSESYKLKKGFMTLPKGLQFFCFKPLISLCSRLKRLLLAVPLCYRTAVFRIITSKLLTPIEGADVPRKKGGIAPAFFHQPPDQKGVLIPILNQE